MGESKIPFLLETHQQSRVKCSCKSLSHSTRVWKSRSKGLEHCRVGCRGCDFPKELTVDLARKAWTPLCGTIHCPLVSSGVSVLASGNWGTAGEKLAWDARPPATPRRCPALPSHSRRGQSAHSLSWASPRGRWQTPVSLEKPFSESLSSRNNPHSGGQRHWTLSEAWEDHPGDGRSCGEVEMLGVRKAEGVNVP